MGRILHDLQRVDFNAPEQEHFILANSLRDGFIHRWRLRDAKQISKGLSCFIIQNMAVMFWEGEKGESFNYMAGREELLATVNRLNNSPPEVTMLQFWLRGSGGIDFSNHLEGNECRLKSFGKNFSLRRIDFSPEELKTLRLFLDFRGDLGEGRTFSCVVRQWLNGLSDNKSNFLVLPHSVWFRTGDFVAGITKERLYKGVKSLEEGDSKVQVECDWFSLSGQHLLHTYSELVFDGETFHLQDLHAVPELRMRSILYHTRQAKENK